MKSILKNLVSPLDTETVNQTW